ncbi:MAG: hypothetical protein OXH63_18430 [Gemmatimonadetes bacterium]|nr:hypothetical protein [Gemmatimonadota bacterium]
MSNNNLNGFEDQVRRVRYAYKNTQRQFDEHPPNDDLVAVAAAINAWTLICGCYMGIEQTMKLLIRMRDKTPAKTHDLESLYSSLDPTERDLVATYYRVYRSLHNFDSGNIALDTAKEFIEYIGNGYVAWRYILVENPEKVPKICLGLMLETWRALVDLVNLRVSNGTSYRTVATILEQDYIMGMVYRDAESDDEWQAASQDENSGVEFKELFDWFQRKGRFLQGGIDLFSHHARGTGDSMQASPVLRRVLLRAAEKAVGGPLPTRRRADIAMFHHRIRNDGLTWNSDKGVFEHLPSDRVQST